jgi:hypothetical protein
VLIAFRPVPLSRPHVNHLLLHTLDLPLDAFSSPKRTDQRSARAPLLMFAGNLHKPISLHDHAPLWVHSVNGAASKYSSSCRELLPSSSIGEYRGQFAEFLGGCPVIVGEYGEQTRNCSSDFARHGVALVGGIINRLQVSKRIHMSRR